MVLARVNTLQPRPEKAANPTYVTVEHCRGITSVRIQQTQNKLNLLYPYHRFGEFQIRNSLLRGASQDVKPQYPKPK